MHNTNMNNFFADELINEIVDCGTKQYELIVEISRLEKDIAKNMKEIEKIKKQLAEQEEN